MAANTAPGANRAQRVGVFVDAQSLFHAAKTLYQSKVDYRKLLGCLVQDRALVRAVVYTVCKPDVDQGSFLGALRKSGYETREKLLAVRDDGTFRGDWKVEITLDALTMASKLDCVVLVSGDGDFAALMDVLSAKGCRTEVASFEQCTSRDLIDSCDDFLAIPQSALFREDKFNRTQQRGGGGGGGGGGGSRRSERSARSERPPREEPPTEIDDDDEEVDVEEVDNDAQDGFSLAFDE